MGQYYIVNIDKKQYLHPHKFGDGIKLMEFGCSSLGVLTGLTILLASGLHSDNPIIGSWAGDRIVIAGDYADEELYVTEEDCKNIKDDDGNPVKPGEINLHTLCSMEGSPYHDISFEILLAMSEDGWVYENMSKRFCNMDICKDLKTVKDTEPENYPTILNSLKTEDAEDFVARTIKEM